MGSTPARVTRGSKLKLSSRRKLGAVVQRIGHIPSKDTMLVRFQPASPFFVV